MPPGDKSDLELLRLLRSEEAADRAAVAAYLLDRYGEEVKREVGRIMGDTNDYLLILDDAIIAVRIAVREDRYDPTRQKLIPFFFGIVKKRTLTAIRNNKRREGHYQNYRFLWERNTDDSENSPEQQLLKNERRELLARAMLKLDDDCREILNRYWWLEEKLKDIGEDLKMSDVNIRQKHIRCLKKLKEILKKMLK